MCAFRRILLALLGAAVLLSVRPASAQQTRRITGDRLSGFVLPIEPQTGDIRLVALRATAWTIDDTKRLLLQGDVAVRIGGHSFSGDRAVVWLNRIPSADGLINQIAVYFDVITDPTKGAGLGAAGRDVLITASARGEVTLDVGLLRSERSDRSDFVRRADARLARVLQQIATGDVRLRNLPKLDEPPKPVPFVPVPGGVVREEDVELPKTVELPPPQEDAPWLAAPGALVRFSAEQTELIPGEHEDVIVITGSLVVEYEVPGRGDEIDQITLTAERGVIFAEPGLVEGFTEGRLDASAIHGIYLESNVVASANRGEYVVRAPKMFYDFQTGQAVMANAILRTYVREIRMPVYARAVEMRQVAANQWDAKKVRISTSEFFTPHIAIGADEMVVTQRPERDDPTDEELLIDARSNTLRVAGLPVFLWPRFRGTIEDIPLRSAEMGTADNDGVRVETKWDLFALAGKRAPKGTNTELLIDTFTKRGAAVGLNFEYDVAAGNGEVQLYGMYDDGTDRTSAGREVDYNEDFRGYALWEHQRRLSRHWLLQLQGAYISDATFMSAWREEDFTERREFETSGYLKYQERNQALTLLAQYELNDFISNDYLLASRQYQVDRLPDLGYRRYGDSLFSDSFTYSSETRVGRMRIRADRSTPAESGVRARGFGIDEDEQFSNLLRDAGYTSKYVSRIDTRHELSMPEKYGIFDVTPFVVGRFTGYDHDFAEFSSDADEIRAHLSGGVRVATQFQYIDNSVESRLFDLHRLRHIVEPSMTLWYGWTDVSQSDLPVYDESVESIGDGTAVRFGVRNTWQTQRGGPGRWRSVDVLILDTDLVLHSDDADRESPTPQFFDYRPEYSQAGDHVAAAAQWLISDALSVLGEGTYDLDESAVSRGSIGTEIRHSPVFVTFVEYRYIDASDNQLLGVGWRYQVTPKYHVSISPQWDFREDEFRSVSFRGVRRFPDFDFTVQVRYDQIRDDTTFGASIGLVDF